MMMGQIYKKARTNPNFGRSNNEYYNFFLPMEYRPAASLRYSTTQFVVVSLCCVSLQHYEMKFIGAFFFSKGFSAKQQKKPKKKEIITVS